MKNKELNKKHCKRDFHRKKEVQKIEVASIKIENL